MVSMFSPLTTHYSPLTIHLSRMDFSSYNFSGKKALVRVDFNVPLNDKFEITDDNRIRAAIPTIKKILHDGGSVILMSHLGRPKEGPTDKYSLRHLVPHLEKVLGVKVQFADDCIGEQAKEKAGSLKAGEVLLLENLRFYKQEEKGDKEFAKKLATLGNVYVNDAFGTAHRAHASTAVIAEFFPAGEKLFGLLMEGEVKSAEKVLKNSEKPFTAIMGGAKVSDKILLIENLLEKADHIIIGGGMAYTFFKAQGGEIGSSLVEEDRIETAKQLLTKAQQKGVKIHLPADSIIADKFDANANTKQSDNNKIPSGWMGLDIGPKAISDFEKVISSSRTILWNGPMGVFEMEKFQQGTKAVAQAIATATQQGAFSLIGGGDSVAAVNQFGFSDKVSYVSTGGGAMLEFFEGKELPGIAAINQRG
jgi:phosphoglycerate kinase